MTLWTVAQATMWAGLLPLAACAVYWIWRWTPPANAVLLSVGFAVSFIADLIGKTLAEQQINTRFLSFLWPPVMLALWWAIVAVRESVRWTGVITILLGGMLSFIQGPLEGLEIVVRCLGSIAIILLVWKTVGFERYRVSMLVMALGMIVFAIPLKAVPTSHPVYLYVWGGFQAVRLVALLLMAWAILAPRTLEVIDGRGTVAQARREGRSLDRPLRGHRRPPLAQA
jgi:hypothetical protein